MAQIDPFWRDTHGLARPSTADHNGGPVGVLRRQVYHVA